MTSILRKILSIILFILGLIILNNASPIYKFANPQPFYGDYIYNPYSTLDTTYGWSRANFHTHTRVKGPLNECEFEPQETVDFYKDYDYDIVTISNHMEITPLLNDSEIATPVTAYEHGYNLLNYHHLVINPEDVCYFEYLTPFFASQKQYLIDRLSSTGDIIFLNHIHRSRAFNPNQMEKLTGYNVIEADNSFDDNGSDLKFWDIALSAGQYSGNAISDDLHAPDKSEKIARRSTLLNIPSTSYTDLKKALLTGNYYSLKTPDFGKGDLSEKVSENLDLPYVENILLTNDTIVLDLSESALYVNAIGQNGRSTMLEMSDGNIYKYYFRPEDTYIRLHADFGESFEIYTNPFARSIDGNRPPIIRPHTVNIPLSIFFNLTIILFAFCFFYSALNFWRKK